MKTTVEVPGALLGQARELARRDRTTLDELIEAGLRAVIQERSRRTGFVLPDASVGGAGLRSEFRGASWEQLRNAAYRLPT